MYQPIKISDFNAIRLKLASPEEILKWSHGEVLKPETINYRTQRPEKDGLFCEKIFGPSKDWECYCGKYKKIRYKGIICDKCGVEVTRSIVRRERMGHIKLSAPVSHIWFLRGVPSKIGLILDISVQNLEKVIYFANFIITHVNEDLRKQTLEQLKAEYVSKKKGIEGDHKSKIDAAKKDKQASEKTVNDMEDKKLEMLNELEEKFLAAEKELKDLKRLKIISENEYHELSLKYGHVFDASIGAEAIHKILKEIDLVVFTMQLEKEVAKVSGAKHEKLLRRIKLLKNLQRNNIRPEWMIMTMIPVIPPDLRPMVPLDGGRFATSDLNDLYRRIINRNNRLKQLIELKAPEVITRNEKRMLQEAFDALIDNGARHGKTVTASTGQKRMLKSLADMLKGKQGRFRQNLLGKRTDYSGRSVIVVGPKLKMYECGLPKKMALELFKPFVMSRLIKQGYVHNVRSAARFIESDQAIVWDILEELTKDAHVLLNRAPTLHRLGIQAFKPILIEGKAIRVHPLVCAAFNADFDGDQMAVHLPLTAEAREEAATIMLSSRNLLKPATGDPITGPTMDIVWGCYYLTYIAPEDTPDVYFSDFEEALLAYSLRRISLQKNIHILQKEGDQKYLATSAGRIIFNQIFQGKMPFINGVMDKKMLNKIIGEYLEKYGIQTTSQLLDDMKEMGFRYITKSGLSWGMDDVPDLNDKKVIIEDAEKLVDETTEQFEMGLLTDSERYTKVVDIWTQVKEKIAKISQSSLPKNGPVATMLDSGSRGNWSQLTQIVGMKGLVTNPVGEIIELPIKKSFKEGFGVLEYFISTHGARKGLSDTALRTANAGYLTRRLVDVSQEIITRIEDCGTHEGIVIPKAADLKDRIEGRFAAEDVVDPKSKKVLAAKDTLLDKYIVAAIEKSAVPSVKIRSLLSCESPKGVCVKCYGYDLGTRNTALLGAAVGVIAAQSIGEPGTQLTMRTFHTGGIAGHDITQGLPRVEEIFEARTPKRKAFLAENGGKVKIVEVNIAQDSDDNDGLTSTIKQKAIQIAYMSEEVKEYKFQDYVKKASKKFDKKAFEVKVKEGSKVGEGTVLFYTPGGDEVLADMAGKVSITDIGLSIAGKQEKTDEYLVPLGMNILVSDGTLVEKGEKLTEGNIDLKQLYRLKGVLPTQEYIIKEIKEIYASQGQKLNDKHVEIISRQMFSRVSIKDPGDTDLLPGDIIERSELLEHNAKLQKGQKKAVGERLLLGVTKVSLSTRSFLAAASFQETAKVLINAAINGKVDRLEGLKENVIIGRLIPVGASYKPDQPKKSSESIG